VLSIERGDGSIDPPPLRTGSDSTEVIRGTFNGVWAKNATVTVTDSVLSSVTYKAKNYFASVGSSAATDPQQCMITYAGGEWVLVSAQPTAVTIISDVKIVGDVLRFSTAQVNVMGPGFGDSYIDVGLESC
jgi:hypothetical protein